MTQLELDWIAVEIREKGFLSSKWIGEVQLRVRDFKVFKTEMLNNLRTERCMRIGTRWAKVLY